MVVYGVGDVMNFKDWYEQEIGSENKPEYEAAKWAWNHQQAKIGELQGRIDGALNKLCKLQYSSGERIYSEVGNILKGSNQHIHKFEEITVNGDDARKYICIYCGFEKSESFND